MSLDRTAEDAPFVSKVCWHYYINEMTQAEIAELLGVTRLRVNQAIQRAKALGMVKVHIESPFLSQLELQERLRERFGLSEVLVAASNPGSGDFHTPTGAALANYLLENLHDKNWKRIGVSWGMTLKRAIEKMTQQSCPDIDVISMLGGTAKGETFNTFGIASGFAERLKASYSLLVAPIFLSAGVDRDAFLAQDVFVEHFAKLESLDAAILTASNVSEHSYLISSGLPSGVTQKELIACGAAGDLVGRFIDSDGNDVASQLSGRTIGISLDVLKAVPVKILAAAGEHKVGIIRAGIKRGLVDTLITDDVTAGLLLEAG